ncbi:MAG: hypothetical protein KF738_17410 [Burkholderiales bacterium]|nr:hypothetical protein [Burkholderiales bacterium]
MKPDFSEFSYGYAFTEELVTKHSAMLVGAPLFPSLYKEGKADGGYDVKIPLKGKPVFLQFKLSDYLQRKNAKECQDGLLKLPYFRMHLRPTKHSDQHNLLMALEAKGETVLYVAPEFHLPAELNANYLAKTVVANSAAFAPSAIGSLPTKDEHYIAFQKGASFGYRRSDEALRILKLNLTDGVTTIVSRRQAEERQLGDDGLRDMARRMIEVVESRQSEAVAGILQMSTAVQASELPQFDIDGLKRIAESRRADESVNYIARTVFDAEVVIVQ